MRRTCGAVCLSALVGAWPAPSVSSEYRDSDVLPEIRYVAFTRDAVGFVSRPNRQFGGRDPVFRFAYDRGSRKLAEVDARQFQARFPAGSVKDGPREASRGSEQHELIGHASNGAEYRSKVKYCGEGVEDERRNLTVGNKAVRILARDKCTSVSSVEIVGDQLWLGTAYSGESGYSGAEGIIVESAGGGRVLATLPLKGWVAQLRADPFSDDLWAATEYGVYRVSRQFQIVSANLYYHDFDPSTGEPRFSFSGGATPGNPLSVVSRMLPAGDRKGFYEVVRKIPQADAERFKLYYFFMCCDFAGRGYPASFRPLLPFFVRASVQDPELAYRNLWRQAACGFATPDVEQYCSRSK